MGLTLVALAGALGASYGFGGRLWYVSRHGLKRWGFLVAGAVAQLPVGRLPTPWSLFALLVCLALLVSFALFNLDLVGFLLVAVGIALNGLVISLNLAMPVHEGALEAAGARESQIRSVGGVRHRLARPDDKLLPLADTIGIPAMREVVSVGDIALNLGLAAVVFALMRPPKGNPPPSDHSE